MSGDDWIALLVAVIGTWAIIGLVRLERRESQRFYAEHGRMPTNDDYLDGDAFR